MKKGDTIFRFCGYRLIYPFLKKKYWGIRVNFYNKYLIALDQNGNFENLFVSRVNVASGYELYSSSTRSNFFKFCKATFGVTRPEYIDFVGIRPDDLIGKYFIRTAEGKFKKAPKETSFDVKLAKNLINYCSDTPHSKIRLLDSMVREYVSKYLVSEEEIRKEYED